MLLTDMLNIQGINPKSLRGLVFGQTASKVINMLNEGAKESDFDFVLLYQTKVCIEEYNRLTTDLPKGLKIWTAECGLSYIDTFLPANLHGIGSEVELIKQDNKAIYQCQYLIRFNTFDCGGNPFRQIDACTYIRRMYRRYELLLVSDNCPKLSQKEVRNYIKNFYKYDQYFLYEDK